MFCIYKQKSILSAALGRPSNLCFRKLNERLQTIGTFFLGLNCAFASMCKQYATMYANYRRTVGVQAIYENSLKLQLMLNFQAFHESIVELSRLKKNSYYTSYKRKKGPSNINSEFFCLFFKFLYTSKNAKANYFY